MRFLFCCCFVAFGAAAFAVVVATVVAAIAALSVVALCWCHFLYCSVAIGVAVVAAGVVVWFCCW